MLEKNLLNILTGGEGADFLEHAVLAHGKLIAQGGIRCYNDKHVAVKDRLWFAAVCHL